MNFIIKCETFLRLSSVCDFFEPSLTDETKRRINTVRLENKSGKSFAIATNEKIAVVEYLGVTDHADGCTHLKITKQLKEQATLEAMFDGQFNVTVMKEVGMSNITTTTGFIINDCCHWLDDTPLNKWRTWGAKNSDKSRGIMYMDVFHIETLIKSSPSGKIYFPEFIDIKQPTTVRDCNNESWVGLFIPEPEGGKVITKQAELPEWWNE